MMLERRALLGGAAAGMLSNLAPHAAMAKIDSTNPAKCAARPRARAACRPPASARSHADLTRARGARSNYYFPMAKYRYLPRIFRAWIAADDLGPNAVKGGDWEGVGIVAERLDDASSAMPLYTNAVEGSRSSKRKKKSPAQKQMIAATATYKKAGERRPRTPRTAPSTPTVTRASRAQSNRSRRRRPRRTRMARSPLSARRAAPSSNTAPSPRSIMRRAAPSTRPRSSPSQDRSSRGRGMWCRSSAAARRRWASARAITRYADVPHYIS